MLCVCVCVCAVMPSVMERSGAGVLSRSRAKTVTNGNSQPHSEEESSDEEHAHGTHVHTFRYSVWFIRYHGKRSNMEHYKVYLHLILAGIFLPAVPVACIAAVLSVIPSLHPCPLPTYVSPSFILSFTHWLPVDLWGAHFKIRNGSFTQLVFLSVTFLPSSVPSIRHPSSLSCSFWLHSFHPSAHVSIIPFSSLPVLCPKGTCNLSLPPSGLLPCISHSLSSRLAFHILQLPSFLLALPQR